MSLFRSWLERLLGLRAEVEDYIACAVRVNTAVAGAVAEAETLEEA